MKQKSAIKVSLTLFSLELIAGVANADTNIGSILVGLKKQQPRITNLTTPIDDNSRKLHIWATSEVYQGDLAGGGNVYGNGDLRCQTDGILGGLAGNYQESQVRRNAKALLRGRLDNAVKVGLKYYNNNDEYITFARDGKMLISASDNPHKFSYQVDDYSGEALSSPIVHYNGDRGKINPYVWTGESINNYKFANKNCSDFTSSSKLMDKGVLGSINHVNNNGKSYNTSDIDKNFNWNIALIEDCSKEARIYCAEQLNEAEYSQQLFLINALQDPNHKNDKLTILWNTGESFIEIAKDNLYDINQWYIPNSLPYSRIMAIYMQAPLVPVQKYLIYVNSAGVESATTEKIDIIKADPSIYWQAGGYFSNFEVFCDNSKNPKLPINEDGQIKVTCHIPINGNNNDTIRIRYIK